MNVRVERESGFRVLRVRQAERIRIGRRYPASFDLGSFGVETKDANPRETTIMTEFLEHPENVVFGKSGFDDDGFSADIEFIRRE